MEPGGADCFLTKTVPLILTGLAVAVAQKSRVFNIGAEGQLLVGAFAAGYVGFTFHLPAPLHILLCLAAAVIAGMFWALLLHFKVFEKCSRGYRKLRHVKLYCDFSGSVFCLRTVWEPGATFNATSAIAADTAKLPQDSAAAVVFKPGVCHSAGDDSACWFLLNKTTTGYEMRRWARIPTPAAWAGSTLRKYMFMALVLSGALAGLAGGIEVSGSLYRVMEDSLQDAAGFNGIPVAMMANGNPIAIFFSAFLLGAMRTVRCVLQIQLGISRISWISRAWLSFSWL